MVSDPEIERIAVEFVIAHEESQGRVVESVEAENRGFDLISRSHIPKIQRPPWMSASSRSKVALIPAKSP